MKRDNKEKINLVFLIILLSMLVSVIFDITYVDKLNVFRSSESGIVKDLYYKSEIIEGVISELNLFYYSTNLSRIREINESTIKKYNNGTFTFDKRIKSGNAHFIGTLDENNELSDKQLIDINIISKLVERSSNLREVVNDFKYCIYISDNDYTGVFPYDTNLEEDNIYFRNILSTIGRSYKKNNLYYKRNSTYNINSYITYIPEYNEYLDVVSVKYNLEVLGNTYSGNIYLVYELDPKRYFLENDYDNYIIYSDLTTLSYKDGNVEMYNYDTGKRIIGGTIVNDIKEMSKNNIDEQVFKTNFGYHKINILNTTENMVVSKVSKKYLVIEAIKESKLYIFSFFMVILGFMIFLRETNNNRKLNSLLKNLEDTNEKLLLVNKIDIDTDLYNRQYILENIDKLDSDIYVIIISIYKIKFINDIYGNEIGDKVVIELAKLLKSFFTKSNKIARWSGKDFMVLYNDDLGDDIKSICMKVNSRVENLIIQGKNGEKVNFTLNYGISKKEVDKLGCLAISEAEEALNYGKSIGIDTIVEYKELNKEKN